MHWYFFVSLKQLFFLTVSVLGLCVFQQGKADSLQTVFASKLSTEYDSNPSLSPGASGSWVAYFQPAVTVTKVFGTDKIVAGFNLLMQDSSNLAVSSDSVNPAALLNWLHSGENRTLDLKSSYIQTSTRYSGIDSVGRTSSPSSTRDLSEITGDWIEQSGQRSNVELNGLYDKATYQDSSYNNYELTSASLKFSYEIYESSVLFGKLSRSNLTLPLGVAISLPQTFNEEAVGIEWTGEKTLWKTQLAEAQDNLGNSTPEALMDFKYTGQFSESKLATGQMLVASGMGGFVKADQVKFNSGYALSEYIKVGLDYSFIKNLIPQSIGYTSQSSLGWWFENEVSATWKCRTYYANLQNKGEGVTVVFNNVIGLSLSYSGLSLF